MLDALAPDTTLRATLVGPIAARALREGARGSVRAVFERSFYVSLDAGWVCPGPEGLGAGPLTLLCEPWPTARPASVVLQAGDAAWVEGEALRAGPVTIPLAAAQTWHPGPPGAWSSASLARGLAAFADALPATLPQEGLARLLRPTDASHLDASGAATTPAVLSAAQAPVRYLTQLLKSSAAADGIRAIDAEQIAPLIGLGPGLTPSGDDYLGGALVALSLTGQATLRDRLWRALEPQLAAGTGDISRAHLAAAAEGLGSAALHRLLDALLAGRTDSIPAALAPVAAIGHTSGWDALAGAVSALCATSPCVEGEPSTRTRGEAMRPRFSAASSTSPRTQQPR